MSARDELAEVFGEGGHGDNSQRFADELYAKVRAEVVREAESRIGAMKWAPGSDDYSNGREAALIWARGLLRGMADEAGEEQTAPDFFQPGRTYTSGAYSFRCDAVAPHPRTGELRALGWFDRRGSFLDAHALDPDDWAHGGWVATEDGAR